MTQANDKLEKSYNRVKKAQEDLARVNTAIEQNKAAISATKTELVKTTGVITTAGTAFYKSFITPAAGLQEQMSTVKAISGASIEEMTTLNNVAKEMGATTKFTAIEAGKALEYMANASEKDFEKVSNAVNNAIEGYKVDTNRKIAKARYKIGNTYYDARHYQKFCVKAKPIS